MDHMEEFTREAERQNTIERSVFKTREFYENHSTQSEEVKEEILSLVESPQRGLVFGPEGAGKKSTLIDALSDKDVGYIDLKVIRDVPLQEVPKDGEFDFFEFTGDILYKDNLDGYIIFNCSLLRKEEMKQVLDYLEMFTDNEDSVIQVWNYSEYLSLEFNQPMFLEKYGKASVEFPVLGLDSNHILENSRAASELDETLGQKKLSSTRKRVLEVLLNGIRGEYPNYYANHYSTREITSKINERYEVELSKNTVSSHISALKKFNVLNDGVQEGREVEYSLKNSVVKSYVESLLYRDKYGN